MANKSLARWTRSLGRKSRADLLRYLYAAVVVLIAVASGWGFYRVAVFASTTERLEVRKISVSGLDRVSENEVLARAGYAPGTNILQVELDKTREAVEEILWVREAVVERVWPDEIVISVVERESVALARIEGRIYQVDADGVILPLDARSDADRPILQGLETGDTAGNIAKVGIYRETLDAIGESALSEVHVLASGDVSVVPIDDPVLVDLGLTEHRSRWEKYLRLRADIHRDYPTALRIDLRFRDQVIIQTEETEPAGKVLWGEETKLL